MTSPYVSAAAADASLGVLISYRRDEWSRHRPRWYVTAPPTQSGEHERLFWSEDPRAALAVYNRFKQEIRSRRAAAAQVHAAIARSAHP